MPDKNTFDWMRQQLNGFMRTQIIGAAAALSLGDHLRNGPRAVQEIASATGIDRGMTFRLLRALAVIGLVGSEDERTFYSLSPLETLRSDITQRRRSICRGAISSKDSGRDCHRHRPHWAPTYSTTTHIILMRSQSSTRPCRPVRWALLPRLDSGSIRREAFWR